MGNPLNIKYAIPEPFTTIPQKLNRRSLLLKTQTGRQTRQHWQTRPNRWPLAPFGAHFRSTGYAFTKGGRHVHGIETPAGADRLPGFPIKAGTGRLALKA